MRLKVEYHADDVEDNVHWSPQNFHIWLNGLELDLVSELRLVIIKDSEDTPPVATITFTPDEIDIDMDTITALTALLEAAEAVADDEVVE